MALHYTLRLLTTTYQNKPVYIFILNCVNSLCLLSNYIKHSMALDSHPNKVTLASIIQMLLNHRQMITIFKVRATPILMITNKPTNLQKKAANFTSQMPNNLMNKPTRHLIVSKNIGGTQWTKHLTKAPFVPKIQYH